jgi:hypothetical protein
MCRRLAIAIGIAAGLLAMPLLAGCGASDDSTKVAEGEPLTLGQLEYNVVISRFLNPDDTEDAGYLVKEPPLQGDQLYLGVFMQVANNSDSSAGLPLSFKVIDTQGQKYEPIASSSPYALPLGHKIGPGTAYPVPDSTAAVGPIEGSMVLFRIKQASTEDRPLELEIPSSASGETGTVELDI